MVQLALAVTALLGIASAARVRRTTTHCNNPFKYNVVYMNYWGTAADIEGLIDDCFNVIMLAFWVGHPDSDVTYKGHYKGIAEFWYSNWKLPALQNVLAKAEANDVKLMLSVGGATYDTESILDKGAEYGRKAAQAANYLGLHGVDFDMELGYGNTAPFKKDENGRRKMQDFAVAATNAARQTLPVGSIISHAPMAPYLGTYAGSTRGYAGIMKSNTLDVDFLNIQFYNQESYTTYDNLFLEGNDEHLQRFSAVAQMIDYGVPADKIVVGKYRSQGPDPSVEGRSKTDPEDGTNGYVAPEKLHEFACRFQVEEKSTIGGFMVWRYGKGDGGALMKAWAHATNQKCSTGGSYNPTTSKPSTTSATTTKATTTKATTTKATTTWPQWTPTTAAPSTGVIDRYFCAHRTNGLYVNPKDCRKFYQCHHRYTYPMTCPSRLVFSEEKQYCDWRWAVSC